MFIMDTNHSATKNNFFQSLNVLYEPAILILIFCILFNILFQVIIFKSLTYLEKMQKKIFFMQFSILSNDIMFNVCFSFWLLAWQNLIGKSLRN